ncbi:CMP/dCMP deaminase zinc-binding [Desulfobacula toluolica Tol2]|uniref:CMP/dCMP deaminase zinc-binding n=2 Tax=Desulfobacula toluolica TaxID=28223 RepID=K0NCQ0_DESTT|nr:CMP/dCMP deaminase zinc-binding [Desulfobacula toluolica Tol2]
MGLALEQAQIAFDRGEFPVGCVIVQDEKVIAVGARQGTTLDRAFFSEIDHAEIRALKQLEVIGTQFDPERSVLFCTMEPCLMCLGAIILSGIKKIVYAYEDPMGGGTTCDLKRMAPLYKNCGIDIVSGVLREKSLDLFCNFFNKETNLYWKNSYLETYTLEQKK